MGERAHRRNDEELGPRPILRRDVQEVQAEEEISPTPTAWTENDLSRRQCVSVLSHMRAIKTIRLMPAKLESRQGK